MNAFRVFSITFSVALLIVGVGLYWYIYTSDNLANKQAIEFLRKAQRLDAQWSTELTRVRSDSEADFDKLASFIPRMAVVKDFLRNLSTTFKPNNSTLQNDLRSYLSELDAKEERIERFKTNFAVYRNSVRFLPLAAGQVSQQANLVQKENISSEIDIIQEDMESYIRNSNQVDQKRVQLKLDKMEQVEFDNLSLTDAVNTFLSHVHVILDRKVPMETMLREAIDPKTINQAELLIQDFTDLSNRNSKMVGYAQHGLLIVIGLLFLVGIIGSLAKRKTSQLQLEADNQISNSLSNDLPSEDKPNSDSSDSDTVKQATIGTMLSQEVFAGIIADQLDSMTVNLGSRVDQLRGLCSKLINQITEFTSQTTDSPIDQSKLLEVSDQLSSISSVTDNLELNTNNASELVLYLNKYAQKSDSIEKPDWLDIKESIESCIKSLSSEKPISIDRQFQETPMIYAKPNEVKSIIEALINNSVQSIEKSKRSEGRIRIVTQGTEATITLTITDNGHGLKPEELENVFVLFSSSEISDIGLNITKYLVSKLGGKILINSHVDQGTAVRVVLPTRGSMALAG